MERLANVLAAVLAVLAVVAFVVTLPRQIEEQKFERACEAGGNRVVYGQFQVYCYEYGSNRLVDRM